MRSGVRTRAHGQAPSHSAQRYAAANTHVLTFVKVVGNAGRRCRACWPARRCWWFVVKWRTICAHTMNKNLWLLALCQGLFLTNNVVFIAINGLVGLQLAPFGWMATLPVMGYVVGGALSTPLVARSQALWGRRVSFQLGLVVAFLSAALCAWAAFSAHFWLLCAATVVAGYYSANGQLYRFAAAELAAPAFREKAVSLVLAGGLLGAVAGPNLASGTRTLFAVPFAGAYIALVTSPIFAPSRLCSSTCSRTGTRPARSGRRACGPGRPCRPAGPARGPRPGSRRRVRHRCGAPSASPSSARPRPAWWWCRCRCRTGTGRLPGAANCARPGPRA